MSVGVAFGEGWKKVGYGGRLINKLYLELINFKDEKKPHFLLKLLTTRFQLV